MLLHACGGFPGASSRSRGLQGPPGTSRGFLGVFRGLQEGSKGPPGPSGLRGGVSARRSRGGF